MRTTSGTVNSPRLRLRMRAAWRDQLVVGRIGEPRELDLGHRVVAGDGHADGHPHDARLGQRRVDDPLLAEPLHQPVGDPEHPAVPAHVLAQDDDLGVALHLLQQRLVDGVHHVQPRHLSPSSPAGP